MAYIFKDNSNKGEFTHISSTRKHNTDDEMLGAGTALIIGGLLGAAAVAAAIDDDADTTIDTERVMREARRRVEKADRAARLGLSEYEVIDEITKFAMKYRGKAVDHLVCATAVVQKLSAQGAKFVSVGENEYAHELVIEGYDSYCDSIKITLNWVGKLRVDCYHAAVTKYDPHGKAFVKYEHLVPDKCAHYFDAIVRVMNY